MDCNHTGLVFYVTKGGNFQVNVLYLSLKRQLISKTENRELHLCM